MSQSTSLFRTTKTRTSRTQEQLNSRLLIHKQSHSRPTETSNSLHQTYGVNLPVASIKLLEPIIHSLTGSNFDIEPSYRTLYTVGIYREQCESIYRCCFIQPEIASATCSVPIYRKSEVLLTLNEITDRFSEAVPCTISDAQKRPQLSGRMTPYVVDALSFDVTWGFANICRSYFLFIHTKIESQTIYVMSKLSIEILKQYFPSYSVCVWNPKTSSYKITVSPEPGDNMNDPNKNSCLYLYGDGSFRFNGKPSKMTRVAESFKEAIDTISESISWSSFVNRLTPLNQK